MFGEHTDLLRESIDIRLSGDLLAHNTIDLENEIEDVIITEDPKDKYKKSIKSKLINREPRASSTSNGAKIGRN